MNDLLLLLKETEVDIYADDATIWSSGATCTEIQQTLNEGLSKANSWFKLSEMQPTIKKTKHLVIGSAKKLYHSEKTTLELDCKTVRIFAYSSTREQSNRRSGTRLKTEYTTLTPRFTDFFADCEKKNRLFCSLKMADSSNE